MDEKDSTEQRINPIVRFAVDRRITMGMCVLGVLVLGWLSLKRLPLEFLPTFSSSHISVRATYRSSSPAEVERLVVKPLEDILGTINGIDTMTSSASAESGTVNVEFVDGTDMDLAAVEVRDRIDRIRDRLPVDLDRLYIRRFQSSDIPVIRMDLSAPWDPDRLYQFTEDVLQRRIERLEGVADVNVRGLRTREIQVNLDPSRMAAYGVDVRDLVGELRRNNVTLSGGYIREGSRKLLVRLMGEFHSLEQIKALPVGATGLRLQDMASIDYAYPRQESFNYLNGSESLSMSVYKASNANLLAVVDRIKAEIEAIKALPEARGLDVHMFFDSSEDVRKGLAELRNTGLIGGVLAVVFMFLFLRRLRTTLLIAIAIPVSIIVTFVIMYLSRQTGLTDLTINLMTLMGLMLAVGMLVDNSIVVIESVFRHRNDLGKDARTASLVGTSEVALPIIASTVTTICVFLPMIFFQNGGHFARHMQNLGTTVCIVMAASLVVALTVAPMAAAIILKGEPRKPQRFFKHVLAAYSAVLRAAIRHRLAFSLVIIGLLYGAFYAYQGIERSLFTPSFQRRITLFADVSRHYSVEQTDQIYKEIYDVLDRHRKELDIANISYRFERGGGRSRSWGGSNRFDIYLVDEKESTADTEEIRDRLQALLPVRAGVTFTVGRSMRGHSRHGSGIEVELVGDRMEVLEILAKNVQERLAQIPSLKDVDSSLESGTEEIHVDVDQARALQVGLSSQGVAQTISSALSSRPVSSFKTDDREIDLVVQHREQDRQTLEQLKKLPVMVDGTPLPVGSLARFTFEPGPRTIEREDRRATIDISVDTAGEMPSFAMLRPITAALDAMDFPAGYGYSLERTTHESEQDRGNALFALLFALVLIYMIMAALFESFSQPFTIMFAVPFAFIGVGIIMKIAGQPRSDASDMGLIILAGIVVNNAIVLIDHINRLRRQGMPRDQAIIAGGSHRLRPILMTAMTTILGLSPMVAPFFFPSLFGAVEGRAAYWAPVGLVILGGLTTSTFLTLVIIPTIYTLVDDLTRFVSRIARAV